LNTDYENQEIRGYTKGNKKQEKFAAEKFFLGALETDL